MGLFDKEFFEIWAEDIIEPLVYKGDTYKRSFCVDEHIFYDEVRLIKGKLYYTSATDFGNILSTSILGGEDSKFVHHCYEENYIKTPYTYNGSIVVLYSNNHVFHDADIWWKASEIYEYEFINGELTQKIDWTRKLKEIQKTISENNTKCNIVNRLQINELIKNEIDYKKVWWLRQILDNAEIDKIMHGHI